MDEDEFEKMHGMTYQEFTIKRDRIPGLSGFTDPQLAVLVTQGKKLADGLLATTQEKDEITSDQNFEDQWK